MSDIYRVVYGKVIAQAIKDLVGESPQERDDAIRYLHSDMFRDHCEVAKYPVGLQDTLDEMLLLSGAEQKFVARMVMEELADGE